MSDTRITGWLPLKELDSTADALVDLGMPLEVRTRGRWKKEFSLWYIVPADLRAYYAELQFAPEQFERWLPIWDTATKP